MFCPSQIPVNADRGLPRLFPETWIKIFGYTQHTNVKTGLLFGNWEWSVAKVIPLVNREWSLLPTPILECIQERDRQIEEVEIFIESLIQELDSNTDPQYVTALRTIKEDIFERLEKICPIKVEKISTHNFSIERRISDIKFSMDCIRKLHIEKSKELTIKINEIIINPSISGTPILATLKSVKIPTMRRNSFFHFCSFSPFKHSEYDQRAIDFKALCEDEQGDLVMAIAKDTRDEELRNSALAGICETAQDYWGLISPGFPCESKIDAIQWAEYLKKLPDAPFPVDPEHLDSMTGLLSSKSVHLKTSCLLQLCKTLLAFDDCIAATRVAMEFPNLDALQEIVNKSHREDKINEVLSHILVMPCTRHSLAYLLKAILSLGKSALLGHFCREESQVDKLLKILFILASHPLQEDEAVIFKAACDFFSKYFLEETLAYLNSTTDIPSKDELFAALCQSLKKQGSKAIAEERILPLISNPEVRQGALQLLERSTFCTLL